MKVRFLADVNFNQYIVSGLLRREPRVDFQTAHEAQLGGKDDVEVLNIAATLARVLVTHDRRTMPAAFGRFVLDRHSSGVLIVPLKLGLAQAIDELMLVWSASQAEDWLNIIAKIPI